MPGCAEDHALLQDLFIGECRKLRGPRGALVAFEALRTPEIALSQAFVIGHDTGLGVCLRMMLSVSHIDRQTQPHVALSRMAGGLPGSLVDRNHGRKLG